LSLEPRPIAATPGLGEGILEICHFPLISWDTADPLSAVGPWSPLGRPLGLPRLEAATWKEIDNRWGPQALAQAGNPSLRAQSSVRALVRSALLRHSRHCNNNNSSSSGTSTNTGPVAFSSRRFHALPTLLSSYAPLRPLLTPALSLLRACSSLPHSATASPPSPARITSPLQPSGLAAPKVSRILAAHH